MQVFLLQNINKLGKSGDLVNVKDGYGRNFLIPRKLAVSVTEGTQRQIEVQKKQVTLVAERQEKRALELKDKIEQISISIPVQAGKDEKIFGSGTSQAIQKKLKEKGISLDRKKIQLDQSIHKLGQYSIPVKITSKVDGVIKLTVVKA